jgi:hypothetical protein
MILWACSGAATGPKEVGEKFLKAMKTGDYDGAKKLATKEAQASIDMMAGMGGGAGGNADDIKVGDVKEDGDKATLSYTDAGKPLTLDLVKEGGDWKANWSKTPAESPLNDLSKDLEGALDDAMDGGADEGTEDGTDEGQE